MGVGSNRADTWTILRYEEVTVHLQTTTALTAAALFHIGVQGVVLAEHGRPLWLTLHVPHNASNCDSQ
jgi:hypothetical protein